MISKKVHLLVKYFHLGRIHQTLEQLRKVLVKGGKLDKEEWLFVNCFRAYLETSDEKKLPFIKTGLEPSSRETTLSSFRRDAIYSCDGDCGCASDEAEQAEIERAKFRKSRSGQAAAERLAIKRAFAEREKSTPSAAAAGQVRAQLLQETFTQAAYPPGTMDKLQQRLSGDARLALSSTSSESQQQQPQPASKTPKRPSPPAPERAAAGRAERRPGWLRRVFSRKPKPGKGGNT
jgi:hypothetical protein